MEQRNADVLILGAGAAGLACRMALSGRRQVTCLEATDRIGGLLGIHHRGAFSFDTTVHALSFRNASTRALVEGLLGSDVHRFRKRNLVWQRGRVIDYPYQFHAHALPRDVRDECIAGLASSASRRSGEEWVSFEDWLLDQFGAGFYRHFFGPYNRKLYGVPPAELEAAPMIWTIPADNRQAVLRGALEPAPEAAPVVECSYPSGRDGIAILPQRIAERGTGEILHEQRVIRVDPRSRIVTTDRGLEVRYRTLVSTLPLPALLRTLQGLPDEIAGWADRLEARSVTVLQIAIASSGPALDAHWTYFPDPEIPFYRLTRLERISPDLAPAGGSACLLECGGDDPPSPERAVELCRELGVAGAGEVACVGQVRIPCAYVLFRRGHRLAAEHAIRTLAAWDVHVAGRYGCWGYANIDQTLESGLLVAEELARSER